MRQAIHILKKDVRRLWPIITLTLALEIVFAAVSPTLIESEPMQHWAFLILGVLLPVSWALLIGAAVHGEGLADDRDFWLTRPYSRRSLLGAKLLFTVCFVSLPLFAMQCGVLVVRGFQIENHVGDLLWAQALVSMQFLSLSFAAAAITRGFLQFALVGGFAALVHFAAIYSFTEQDAPGIGSIWLMLWIIAVIVGVTGLAVTIRMYRRSRAATSGLLILAGGMLAVLLVPFLPWKAAFAIQQSFSPKIKDLDVIRIEPDLRKTQHEVEGPSRRDLTVHTIVIPLSVAMPKSVTFDTIHLAVLVSAPSGEASRSIEAWGEVLNFDRRRNRYRLYFSLDDTAYQQLKDAAVVQMDVYLSVFGNLAARSMRGYQERRFDLPIGDSDCRLKYWNRGEPLFLGCLSAFAPPRATIRAEIQKHDHIPHELMLSSGNLPPILGLSYISVVERRQLEFDDSTSGLADAVDFIIESWQFEGNLRKQMTTAAIRLADFEVRH